MSVLRLKLVIDVEKNKVVFAEAEKEFVDILLSFLTLPFGTIIRLLNKQSSVGCLDNIYKSVEDLDSKYLNTKACKTMLLEPRSSAERLCEDLLIRVDDLEPRRFYRCPNFDCYTKNTKSFSSVAGVICSCSETINDESKCRKVEKEKQVFLKGETTYMITYDLNVFPATTSNVLTLFQSSGIDDVSGLEKREVDVNRDGILSLLKMMLQSRTPLTDAFLNKPCSHIQKKTKLSNLSQIKSENDNEDADKAAILKLVWDKNTKRVLYAEADHVMVDTLFSFLTLPLGSIVKQLNKNSFLDCVDNLYSSIDPLADSNCFVSEMCKEMLSSPCLYWHYDCSHQVLKIELSEFWICMSRGCKICRERGVENCLHNISKVELNQINPKMPNLVTENGGGYAKESGKFMISDEMIITPFSAISGSDVIKDMNVSVSDLILLEVAIGETEVVNLLKACLTSSSALTSVFSMVKKRIFCRNQ